MSFLRNVYESRVCVPSLDGRLEILARSLEVCPSVGEQFVRSALSHEGIEGGVRIEG